MRVGLDLNPTIQPSHKKRGIGKTTALLAHELAALTDGEGPVPGSPERLFFYLGAGGQVSPPLPPRVDPAGPETHVAWRRLGAGQSLLELVRQDRLDILHLQDYFFPLYDVADLLAGAYRPTRVLLTVRDIIPILEPAWNAGGVERLRRNLLPVVQAVDHIVAISRWTKTTLIQFLNVPPERITVIPHGVDPLTFRPDHPAKAVERVRRLYGLPERFVLYVAALNRRKNHDVLVRALPRFLEAVADDWHLVFAGPDTPWWELVELIRANGLEGRVHFLEEVPDGVLPLLYAAASLFAFPSPYEGWGNPLLEAMATGVPVVAARSSAVPEAVGDAALLVDPFAPDAWAEAFTRLATDRELRGRLQWQGLVRCPHFSWRASAMRHLQVYESLVQEERGVRR